MGKTGCWLGISQQGQWHAPCQQNSNPAQGPTPAPTLTRAPHLCTRILPILMPLQQARSAFSMLSPLRMMLTPHSFLAKSTPTYLFWLGRVNRGGRAGLGSKGECTTHYHQRGPAALAMLLGFQAAQRKLSSAKHAAACRRTGGRWVSAQSFLRRAGIPGQPPQPAGSHERGTGWSWKAVPRSRGRHHAAQQGGYCGCPRRALKLCSGLTRHSKPTVPQAVCTRTSLSRRSA